MKKITAAKRSIDVLSVLILSVTPLCVCLRGYPAPADVSGGFMK